MIRVAVDTNVFVSTIIRPDRALIRVLKYIRDNGKILYSTETFSELNNVLYREKFARYTSIENVNVLIKWVATTGELIVTDRMVTASRDPDDNKFLELAICGKADYLITGDNDLLVLGRIETTPIISPAEFLRIISH